MASTRNFGDVLRRQLAEDPDLAERVLEEWFNSNIAQIVYDARGETGLTQQQLADRCGVDVTIISDIEDADYDGHTLSLLNRIAEALGRVVRVEFAAPPFPMNRMRKAKAAKKPRRKPARAKVGGR